MPCYHHQLASDCPENCRTDCQIEVWHHRKSRKRPCPWFIAASSVKVAAKRHKNLIQVAVRGVHWLRPSSPSSHFEVTKRKSNLPHNTSRKSRVSGGTGEMGCPSMGVPQNEWSIMENPMKLDGLGVPPFLETPKYRKFKK